MTSHVLLLLGEATLCGGLMLGLLSQRRRLGLAPVYLVLGTLQFAQFILATSVRIDAGAGVSLSPATVVLFPLTILVVLLTYVEDDAETTRSLAYGIVICNVTLFALWSLAGLHAQVPGPQPDGGLPALASQPWRIIAASSLAIVGDLLAAIVIFEAVSRRFKRSLFLRLWTASAAVMVLDGLLFTTIAFAPRSAFWGLLWSSLLGKLLGATFYSGVTAVYAQWFATKAPGGQPGQAQPADPFSSLTYRQRYEEARSLMTRDALTGLYNRGYFDESAPRQLAHADRAKHQMSLVLIDIDRLKAANDRHGHEAGDDLVRAVAAEIRQMVRTSDVACRYGGDEFVVILTNADAGAARIFSDRLAQNVTSNTAAAEPRAPWAPASISMGIATYPADGTTLRDLLRVADGRLYESKRRGGGQVTGAS